MLNQKANECRQNKPLLTQRGRIPHRHSPKKPLKINSTELQVWKASRLVYFSPNLNRTADGEQRWNANIDLIWLHIQSWCSGRHFNDQKQCSHRFPLRAETSFWMAGVMGQSVLVHIQIMIPYRTDRTIQFPAMWSWSIKKFSQLLGILAPTRWWLWRLNESKWETI